MAAPVQYSAVGRRKTAVARVYLRPGSGKITVNKRDGAEYFPLEWRQRILLSPFEVTGTTGQFDLVVNANGGGLTGQVEAVRLGVARALVEYNERERRFGRVPDVAPAPA